MRLSFRRLEYDSADDFIITACGTVIETITGSTDGGSGLDQTDFAYIDRVYDITAAVLPAVGGTCTFEFNSNANGCGRNRLH